MALRAAASLIVTAPFSALGRRVTAMGSQCDYAVLMVKRVGSGGSFDSAYVFPGGVEEDQDRTRFSGLEISSACAVRETFEETGLLLTTAPQLLSTVAKSLLRSNIQGLSFYELCEQCRISPQQTRLMGRWVTPRAQQRRRFDTRFFLLNIGDSDEFLRQQLGTEHVQGTEIEKLTWIAPDIALQANARGAMPLFPPQAYFLHELCRFRHWQNLVDGTIALDIRQTDYPMEPLLCRRSDDGMIALLPGDRAYPEAFSENRDVADSALFCKDRCTPGLHRIEMRKAAGAGGFDATKLVRTMVHGYHPPNL
ncbi:hypothetical protein COEREDRAFT_79012 [Coemansia reversa NRRL 1564]|uniref:Nudix hydrolase domain-containing protein n=1 Tax=Coemansia reversa (strain ATCC 12441 / NRRL 1564) TaxID=763665 RepID=A0A2G5BM33_COERN|nr:hypothetical protein COEREDRAFT_79012 [Coemansia reversa NRRL 1564]|eukprot:PIA19727.1 hypothetical protein COEREDRAFT_79012 [Coemansia reversa NRRL 1564]